LLFTDWRGYLISGFALVWVANVYMSFFARIRLDVKRERVEISAQEKAIGDDGSANTKRAVSSRTFETSDEESRGSFR